MRWNYGQGSVEGKVVERIERRVQRTFKGTRIVRNGTADNPAYIVTTDDGDHALKRGSELSRR